MCISWTNKGLQGNRIEEEEEEEEEEEGPNIWLAELILHNDKAHSYTALSFVKAVFGMQRGGYIEDCMTRIHLYWNVMHSLWSGWEQQTRFYQKIKLGWKEKLYIYCCVKLNFKKELCFVAFVYTDITGVW